MRVLHLEDSDADAELIAHTLRRELPGTSVRRVDSQGDFEQALGDSAFDVILADYALEGYDGLAAFALAQQRCPETPFLLVSGAIGEENAIEAMRRGVADYVLKDRPARLVPAIRQAMELADEKRRRRATEAEVEAGARRAELLVQVASRLFVTEAEGGAVDAALAPLAAGVTADAFWFKSADEPGRETKAVGQIGDLAATSPRWPAVKPETAIPAPGGAARHEERARDQGLPRGADDIGSPAGVAPTEFPGVAALEQAAVVAASRHRLSAGGRALGVVVLGFRVLRDYSEAEKRFLRTGLDLVTAHLERQRLLRDVRHALRAAEQANRAKDDFLAALSHELRTPLNPVQLLASAGAANEHWPESARQDFATVSAQVALEARLIDDLLEVTRITRNEVSLSFEEVELHDVLEEAIRTASTEAAVKAITWTRQFDRRGGHVRGDRPRLLQAFWKLLDNAVRFSAPNENVTVQTRRDGERIVVTIEDRGIGMTPAELERAFDPFTRGEQTEREETGQGRLGLGLAITRRIVELHGGDVSASSPGPGGGASFVVTLPIQGSAVPGAHGSPPTREPPPDPAEPLRLLLVEDHAATREALGRLLRQRGFEATAVGSVEEARATAAQHEFDLVLSDIGLPDGNGFELMAHLRQQYGLRGIALTGYDVEARRLEPAGFVSFITKPVSIRPLVEAIGRALEWVDGEHAAADGR